MQTVIHRAEDRGVGDHGWLHTRFSFSFAGWYDPHRMGFGALRVINDDVIDPHSGFGKHPHANMEIITIVREGTVSHEDSMGNAYDVPAGDIQVMSAGTGVVHAEFNKGDVPLKLFQIWIEPRSRNITPRYDQKSFGLKGSAHTFELLVSGDGNPHVLHVNQDVYISRAYLVKDEELVYQCKNTNNGVYVFVVTGSVRSGGDILDTRDAMGCVGVDHVALSGITDTEVLVFEVPM